MLPTSAGVEPATSWSPIGRRIQLSHRGQSLHFIDLTGRLTVAIQNSHQCDVTDSPLTFQLSGGVAVTLAYCIMRTTNGFEQPVKNSFLTLYLGHWDPCHEINDPQWLWFARIQILVNSNIELFTTMYVPQVQYQLCTYSVTSRSFHLVTQSTLFIPIFDTTTKFVIMTVWMSRNPRSGDDSKWYIMQ